MYEALRDSGCIKLPSQRTLRDYIKPHWFLFRKRADVNVKSMDHLHVDVIIQNHLPVDTTSEQFSGINILQKILIFLLSLLNR